MTDDQGPQVQAGVPEPLPSQTPSGLRAAQAAKGPTLVRLRRLKGRILLASLLGFGALSGLVAGHQVGAATPTTPTVAPPAATATPSAPNSGDGGGFFGQGGSGDQGGNGYGFGSGGSAQPPVAGSGAS